MADGDWTPELVLEHLKDLLNERDQRYDQRFEGQEKAVTAALAASEKATDAAFAAAEKAVSKAEASQDDRLAAHNGLQQQLKERDAETPSRKEVDLLVRPLAEKISTLENWRSRASGVGAVLVLFSGFIGAIIMRAFGG